MQEKNKERESLGEKIAEILTPVPTIFDPEDDVNEETVAKVVENVFEDEDKNENIGEKLGKIRQSFNFLEDVDKRYTGTKSSRKNIENESSFSGSEDLNDDNKEISEESFEEQTSIDEDSEEEDQDSETEDNKSEVSEDESKSNFKHINDINMKTQVSKGTSVCNQLNIWESLMELRIQMQKCLIASNKMPQKDHFEEIKQQSGSDFANKVSDTKNTIIKTLDKLLQLQKVLLKQYPETNNLDKKKKQIVQTEDGDEEIPSDTEDEHFENSDEEQEESPRKKMKLGDYEKEISKTHELYRNYRNAVIQKWNEKTKIASVKHIVPVYSVVDQIQHILMDREKLIKRSQLKKSKYEILGFKPMEKDIIPNLEESNQSQVADEYNNNIFDDDDFYYHLLRELIEYKSADVNNPTQLGQRWIHLQNLRSKMKRKVDTRATKGRKVRYTVHSKLVNFMAPIDEELITDEAKNELFGSLFGKKQFFGK
ncbi:protein AATF-like [Agrilus planipennis]|uniref:Protein AATF-like n=1 Tax=Agrilus planipennis TaxID=224129 RepID=A0A1W4X7V4_AGRPL|nr:protein AATF-like [Agrilus planipennis]XP_025833855.1 protein AATF-like [Agrilus planipennis]